MSNIGYFSWYTYSLDCVGNGFTGELNLIDVKLLVHEIAKLHIVHLSTSEHS